MIIRKINNALKDLIYNNLPLLIFSVIYYGIVIFLCGYLNIWEDEVYSLNTSSKTLVYALHQSFYFELQPPVYFLLLTIWRFLSDSILWARLFSILLILLSQISLYKFTKKVSSIKIATITSILFLLNPITLYAILEIRPYSLVLFLSLFLIVQFYNTYYIGSLIYDKRIFYILLSIAGLFTQYYIGFILFANAVVLLSEKKFRWLFHYLLDMVIPLCLILLCFPQIESSADLHTATYPEYKRTFSDFLGEVRVLFPGRIFEYILPVDFNGPQNMMDWIFRFIVLTLFLISINLGDLKKGLREIVPLIIESVIILSFFVLIDYLFGHYWIKSRYTIVLFIPLFLILIFLIRLVKHRLLILWFIFFAVICLTKDISNNKGLYKVNDFRSLGNYIESHENINEPILIYRNIIAENLSLYYHGVNELIPIPKAFSYNNVFGLENWKINYNDFDKLKDKLLKSHNFYIVIDNIFLVGVTESKQVLLDFMFQNFTLEEVKYFKSRIELYRFSNKCNLLEGKKISNY